MKKFIDTHCHIFKEYYDDIPFLMSDSNNNFKLLINNAVDIESTKEVLSLINNYNNMYCALGIHPEYADNYSNTDIEYIISNLKNSKVVAIGEIGLDYHYDGYNKIKQIELFNRQLKIAEDENLPVIIHSRDATLDTINELKKYNVKGVIHSFSGSYETAREYIKMGFLLGINGVVTFKNAKLIDVIKKIGIDYCVLETDSPYLSPVPFRGKANNPNNIEFIIKFLSENLYLTEDYIIDKTNANALHVFSKINQ